MLAPRKTLWSTPGVGVEAACELLRLGTPDKVIDVGCGDGRFLLEAAKRGASAVGLEIDAERAEESEEFHAMLSDVALGESTDRVKDFVIAAYVRGARVGCAEKTDFEGSTSVFTKRRYRDRWNRTLVRRIAKTRNHTLKVKGRVRSRGARGNGWFNDRRTLLARRNSRTQSLFLLHMAGDWHPEHETESHAPRPHMMRTMLVSNLAVQERFAKRHPRSPDVLAPDHL